MASSNQLSLFGFDLSVLYRRAVLGLEQLLWGSEAGLRERLRARDDEVFEPPDQRLVEVGHRR